jgi:hypothetical protein
LANNRTNITRFGGWIAYIGIRYSHSLIFNMLTGDSNRANSG